MACRPGSTLAGLDPFSGVHLVHIAGALGLIKLALPNANSLDSVELNEQHEPSAQRRDL